MERLTHEADFGLEDWEETLFFVKSDPNGAYNILDIAKYQGNPEFDEILKHIALRLSSIENILGDDYDLDRLSMLCNQRMTMRDELSQRFSLTAKIPLDRLRELVELYSNVPHICDYCIGCEIEPTDGHGCDGYDNFVFSVRRIVAALKAREQND